MPLASPDPVADLVEQLRAAAPQVFSDGRVDFDRLRAALGDQVDTGPERYGLNWAGKAEAFRNVRAPSIGTLLPMPEDSVNWDATDNLIIEGDNLEVLKLLQKPYHGRVKMIYIDPPYNTGNDFIYRDNYRQSLDNYLRFSGQVDAEGAAQSTNRDSSGRYHSDWLSMMYPRLFLARNLLREDGVIFVSIDDNEVHNLRMLMNEVFGEENRIECFVWKKSYGGGAKERFAVTQHEYVLLYARNIEAIDSLWLPPDQAAESKYYKYKDDKFAKRGPYRIKPLEATKSMDKRENLIFPITAPDGTEVWPKKQWWWSKDRALAAAANDELVFTKGKNGHSISYKQYLRDETGNQRKTKPFSIIDGIYTQTGTANLAEHFDGVSIIQFPKPVDLIKTLLRIGDTGSNDGIVLDFFAGSATTGQSVLELNAEDQGTRKFILVQLPEQTEHPDFPTIAHISRERVRRVIAKLDQENGGKKSDRGFRAFRLSSSNFRIWDAEHASTDAPKLAEQLQLHADNSGAARGEQDVLWELVLKCGLPLSSRVVPVEAGDASAWSVDDGRFLILLNKKSSREMLRQLIALQPRQIVCLDTAFTGDDALKTSIVLEARSRGIAFRTV